MRNTILAGLAAALVLTGCNDKGTDPEPIGPVANVTLAVPASIVVSGRTMQLAVEATTAAGVVVPQPAVSWSTSDAAVAQVSAQGVLTALSAGAVTVKAAVEGKEATAELSVAPGYVPLFRRPFDGDHPLLNAFDHDLPSPLFRAGNITDWRGQVLGGLEGHNGYDWVMPTGTPLYAVADGRVSFAGAEQPWFCSLLGATVSGLYVNVVHIAPHGERFISQSLHLSRLDVQTGQAVTAGQQLGLSGNTGCSTLPHLHFAVFREFYSRSGTRSGVVTDPSGWTGTQADPWLMAANGAASSRLWMAAAEPPLVTTRSILAPAPPALDAVRTVPTLPAREPGLR